jgi:hypothetical protein
MGISPDFRKFRGTNTCLLPGPPPSLIAILPHDEHKSRCKVWDEILTPRALGVYEKRIEVPLGDLERHFADFAKKGKAFDLALWSEFSLFDAIGKIAFVSCLPIVLIIIALHRLSC